MLGIVLLGVGGVGLGTVRADDTAPSPAQKQAIFAKPSVVRVIAVWEGVYSFMGKELKEYAGGHGSGFFVSSDGFIATNAHVVQLIKEGEESAKGQIGQSLMRTLDRTYGAQLRRLPPDELEAAMATLQVVRMTPIANVVLPDGTTLPYTVVAYGAPVGEGQDVAIIKVNVQQAPNLVIGDSARMSVQDSVIAIGYPGAADFDGLFDTRSQLEASITDGTVSAIKRTIEGEPVLQVTTPITHGNSGGPAINARGEVIGLATFGNRDKVQGFNFLVASSTVKKFVAQAKASNDRSETHVLWRASLEDMWGGKYDAALAGFAQVLAKFPAHSEAPRFAELAKQLKAEHPAPPPAAGSGAAGSGSAGAGSSSGSGGAGSGSGAGSGGASGSDGAVAGIVVMLIVASVLTGAVVVMRKKKPAAPGPSPVHHGVPGHVGALPPQPVARTVAIAPGGGHPPVAATAFGSFAIGSLTCTRGQLTGQRFSLTSTGVLIGRQPGQAQIVVNDSRASGKHVWIGYEQGVLVAIDQGTTNGTFVNDVRFGRISKAPLKDGDVVIVSEPDCLSLQIKLG